MKEAGNVPSEPVRWRATHRESKVTVFVNQRLWCEARIEAMQKLKCGPSELDVVRA